MSGFCGSARFLALSLCLFFDVRLSETPRDERRESERAQEREIESGGDKERKGKGLVLLSQPPQQKHFCILQIYISVSYGIEKQ